MKARFVTVCTALALCVAAGSATTAAAEDGVVGGGEQGWSLPAGYTHPTNTSLGGDPHVYKIITPGCGSWYWDSTQRLYAFRCYFRKYHRVYGGYGSAADYLVGEGLAYYYYSNGRTACWGSRERPFSWTVWVHWTYGWCPQFI